MIHTTQDKLQRAAFGTDNQIDTGEVSLKLLIELVIELE